MTQFVGLDVSQKLTAICVVDDTDRSVPHCGSIDHTISSLSCKFWHRPPNRLLTV